MHWFFTWASLVLLCALSTSSVPVHCSSAATLYTSVLWGQKGELFNSTGRLLDWSYAGYAAAERHIPDVEVLVNAKEHGAVGDGLTDDTRAIESAISHLVTMGVKAGSPGALLFPPGTYRIEQPINIKFSGVVLRGSGPDVTTLFLPFSLTDVFGQKWEGAKYTKSGADKKHSDWKSGPGFIRFSGARDYLSSATWLANVKGSAARGSHVLDVPVMEEGSIKPHDWVTLVQGDRAGTLISDLTGNLSHAFAPCTTFCQDTPNLLRFHTRVLAVRHGQVVLERALPWNVSERWRPQLHKFGVGLLHDVGVEHISVVHTYTEYGGHLKEAGWNGIEFKSATNCWARNVHILDSDNALTAWLSSFCTFDAVKIFASEARGHMGKGYDAHHGINITLSNDILVSNFEIDELAAHALSVYAWTYGIVFANGTGRDLTLDHHRLMPFGTLWSNITTGIGKRVLVTGGDGTWGPSSGPFSTFWNVHADNTSLPLTWSRHHTDGPMMNFVGSHMHGGKWPQRQSRGWRWHIEDVPPEAQLYPTELYSAQREKRALQQLRQQTRGTHAAHH